MPKNIDSLSDLLKKKADDIDDAGIKDDVSIIQEELNRQFNKQVVVQKLENGVILTKTASSTIASELRLKQYAILQNLNKTTSNDLKRFRIIIG